MGSCRDSIENPGVVVYIEEIIFTENFLTVSSNRLQRTRIGLATKIRISVFKFLAAENILKSL